MTLRAIGPMNGYLPAPTGMVIAFIRDPRRTPYLRYAQLVAAPKRQFYWWRIDPDEPQRLVDLNSYAWAYDDYMPSGKGFTVKAEAVSDAVQRWCFPYTLGEVTIDTWAESGLNPRMLYDTMRANHARLHRSVRILNAMGAATWPNTGSLATLMGSAGVYWDLSAGSQYLTDGTANPNFQIIKRSFQRVNQLIHLATNSAVDGDELICVMSPAVARAIAASGEMVEFLKQSPFAHELTSQNWKKWGLPESYCDVELVVEDTPRVYISQHDDGTVADVTVPAQKDYILSRDQVYFVSRTQGEGGANIDGNYGFRNFSTVQVYHYGGEARVEAFTEPKHQLVEGRVVMEDKVEVPAAVAGFKLTSVLSPTFV
jgi:hypothetical protein